MVVSRHPDKGFPRCHITDDAGVPANFNPGTNGHMIVDPRTSSHDNAIT